MPLHDVAARGFGEGAAAYEQARPTYPPAAITWIADHLSLGPDAVVCDLGAGTGKLTRLLPTAGRIVAVEPLAGMRAELVAQLPHVTVVGALAEALPFRDATFDTVVVAQAFHWFETDSALAELCRVVRSGGGVALIWNAWDDSVPWVAAIHRVVADAGATAQWQRGHFSRAWAGDALARHPGFGSLEIGRVGHAQTLDVDGIVDRVGTTSHIVAATPSVRATTLRAVRDILERHDDTRGRATVQFPYVTEIYASVRS
jgi:SAM-dependent methyltransferase